jgi:hypothetical protein
MFIFEEGGHLRAKILLPLEADQPHLLLDEGLPDGGDHVQRKVGQGPDGPNELLQLYIVVVQAHETICCQSFTETAFPMVEGRINNKNNPDNLLKGSLFNLLESSPLNNLKGIERLLNKCTTVKNNALVY